MAAIASLVRIRHDIHARLLEARSETDNLFGLVRAEALYDRPVAEQCRPYGTARRISPAWRKF